MTDEYIPKERDPSKGGRPPKVIEPGETRETSFEALVDSGIGMPILTKNEAVQAGLQYFWTGKPCKKGHNAKRRVRGGACAACVALTNAGRTKEYRVKAYQLRKEKKAQKLELVIDPQDRAKVLSAYAETGDLEYAARQVRLTLPELQVQIAKSELFATNIAALEKRMNKAAADKPYVRKKMEWTPEKRELFLVAYVDTGDISLARDAVGATATNLNDEIADNESFAERLEAARPQAEQALEEKAISLALKGNDRLLTVVLKAKKPEYRDKLQVEQTTTIKMDDTALNSRITRLLEKHKVIDGEFTELEPKGQGRLAGPSGRTGSSEDLQQVSIHVPSDGSSSPVELPQTPRVLS